MNKDDRCLTLILGQFAFHTNYFFDPRRNGVIIGGRKFLRWSVTCYIWSLECRSNKISFSIMATQKKEEDNQIENVYYSLSNAGAFAGADKVCKVLRSRGSKISRLRIRKWLQNQDDYSLQKPTHLKFKRPKVVVSRPFEQFDSDLADMSSIAKYNENVRFLLVVIDYFS